jgi:hypothetical protein
MMEASCIYLLISMPHNSTAQPLLVTAIGRRLTVRRYSVQHDVLTFTKARCSSKPLRLPSRLISPLVVTGCRRCQMLTQPSISPIAFISLSNIFSSASVSCLA